MQTIRAALAIKLKEQMGVDNIRRREDELLAILWPAFEKIKGLRILADRITDRLGIVSFTLDGLHYNLVVKLLNDRFGIQARGGCACAGTYGHYLFNISRRKSKNITDRLNRGDLSTKPGFVRISLHPIMTDREIKQIVAALQQIAIRGKEWGRDYRYRSDTNEFVHKNFRDPLPKFLVAAFDLSRVRSNL